jgi:uncharacterized protein (DUF983 family)
MRENPTAQVGGHGVGGLRDRHPNLGRLRSFLHRHDVRCHAGVAAVKHQSDDALAVLAVIAVIVVLVETLVDFGTRRHHLNDE